MGTTQTESLELTSAPGRVGQAPGNSQAREEASQSPVVISKDELPKPVLPAPEEERGDLAGSGQGGGGWGCRLRGRGHAGPRLRVSPAPQPSALLLAPSVQVTGRRVSLRLFLKDIYLAAPGLSCGT